MSVVQRQVPLLSRPTLDLANLPVAPEGIEYQNLMPQPGPQTMFLMSSADIVIYGGQAGGGKSYGLLLDAVRYIEVPHYGAVIFRRITKHITAQGGLWDESMEIYPFLGGTPITGDLEWRFPARSYNPATDWWDGPETGALNAVTFAHMQYSFNRFDWQGSQIPFIGFDELTHFEREQFFYMMSRNRSTSGVKPVIRATTNPDVDSWVAEIIAWWIDQREYLDDNQRLPNPDYGLAIPERAGVVRFFVQDGDTLHWADTKEELYGFIPQKLLVEGLVTADDLIKSLTFIPASVYDNPKLLERDPSYIGSLFALEHVEKERLLGGNWKVRIKGGKVFPDSKVTILDVMPLGVQYRVRWWDFAGTDEKDANATTARTASVKLSTLKDGRIVIEDFVAGWWEADDREREMKNVASMDGKLVAIRFEQEPGSAGKDVKLRTVKLFHGYDIKGRPSSGKKEVRWRPLAAQWQAGNVVLLKGAWNRDFITEMNAIPNGLKDAADAASAAYNEIQRGEDEPSTNADDYVTAGRG